MNPRNRRLRPLAPAAILVMLLTLMGGCGSDDNDTQQDTTGQSQTRDTLSGGPESTAQKGFHLVSPRDAASLIEDPPADLVILDVRTPGEYAEGHIDGSIQLDFYEPDFADRLAELDPEVPYLVYCRSGNRSGQTTQLMEGLGFGTVYDVDGGVVAWAEAGLDLAR